MSRGSNNLDLGVSERRAEIWERSVVSTWESRFAPSLLNAMALPKQGSVLVAECRTGFVAMEVSKRLTKGTRCVAIEVNRDMLDIARAKVPEEGRRIWWDAKSLEQLKYRDGVFGASVCAAGVITKDDIHHSVGRLARLTQPGGQVGLVVPLRGTFREFYDLYREGLLALGLSELEPVLDAFLDELFDEEALRVGLADVGLRQLEVETLRFKIPFNSGQDFLLSPLVESMYLPLWLRLCSDDDVMQDILTYALDAMDQYFDTLGLELTAEAARVIGHVAPR